MCKVQYQFIYPNMFCCTNPRNSCTHSKYFNACQEPCSLDSVWRWVTGWQPSASMTVVTSSTPKVAVYELSGHRFCSICMPLVLFRCILATASDQYGFFEPELGLVHPIRVEEQGKLPCDCVPCVFWSIASHASPMLFIP